MDHFASYCQQSGYTLPTAPHLDPLEVQAFDGSVPPGRLWDIACWFRSQHPTLAGTTVDGYISTIRQSCALHVNWLFKRSPLLDSYLLRYKQQPRHRDVRQPCTIALLRRVFDDATIHIATRTAVLLAFTALLRVGEYTSSSSTPDPRYPSVCVGDVKFNHDGSLSVRIPHSKSDRYNAGEEVHVLPTGAARYCPVQAMRTYLQQHPAGHDAKAPLFVKQTPGGNWSCVNPSDVNRALQSHAAAVGLDPRLVASHSLRIGGAFELANAGVDWETIGVRGRWSAWSVNEMSVMYARLSDTRLRRVTQALNLAKPVASHAQPLGLARLVW